MRWGWWGGVKKRRTRRGWTEQKRTARSSADGVHERERNELVLIKFRKKCIYLSNPKNDIFDRIDNIFIFI
jgi:hypothetical protein